MQTPETKQLSLQVYETFFSLVQNRDMSIGAAIAAVAAAYHAGIASVALINIPEEYRNEVLTKFREVQIEFASRAYGAVE